MEWNHVAASCRASRMLEEMPSSLSVMARVEGRRQLEGRRESGDQDKLMEDGRVALGNNWRTTLHRVVPCMTAISDTIHPCGPCRVRS